MIQAANNHQTWTHTELGLARWGMCAPAPADYAQDTRLRAGRFIDAYSLIGSGWRRVGAGCLPRLRQRPSVRASAARLIPLHPRQCAAATVLPVACSQRISSRAAGTSGRVRYGLGRAFNTRAGAVFSCRLQFLRIAQQVLQDHTEYPHCHLTISCVPSVQRQQCGRSDREWRYPKSIMRCPK